MNTREKRVNRFSWLQSRIAKVDEHPNRSRQLLPVLKQRIVKELEQCLTDCHALAVYTWELRDLLGEVERYRDVLKEDDLCTVGECGIGKLDDETLINLALNPLALWHLYSWIMDVAEPEEIDYWVPLMEEAQVGARAQAETVAAPTTPNLMSGDLEVETSGSVELSQVIEQSYVVPRSVVGEIPVNTVSDGTDELVDRIWHQWCDHRKGATIAIVNAAKEWSRPRQQQCRAEINRALVLGTESPGDEVETESLVILLQDAFGQKLLDEVGASLPPEMCDAVVRAIGNRFLKEKLPWASGDLRIRARRGDASSRSNVVLVATPGLRHPIGDCSKVLQLTFLVAGRNLQAKLTADSARFGGELLLEKDVGETSRAPNDAERDLVELIVDSGGHP